MPRSDSGQANPVTQYRPPCSKCGAPTTLARIEPAPELDHDLRTFECETCRTSVAVRIKFR